MKPNWKTGLKHSSSFSAVGNSSSAQNYNRTQHSSSSNSLFFQDPFTGTGNVYPTNSTSTPNFYSSNSYYHPQIIDYNNNYYSTPSNPTPSFYFSGSDSVEIQTPPIGPYVLSTTQHQLPQQHSISILPKRKQFIGNNIIYEHDNVLDDNYQQYIDQQTQMMMKPKEFIPQQSKVNLIGARFYRKDRKQPTPHVVSTPVPQPNSRPQQRSYSQQILSTSNAAVRNVARSTQSLTEKVRTQATLNQRVMVEYWDKLMGETKLGVITGRVVDEKSELFTIIDSKGESAVVDSSQFTYEISVDSIQNASAKLVDISSSTTHIESIKDMEQESQKLVERVTSKQIEDLWKRLLNSRKSFQVNREDVAANLFNSQTPITLYAAHRILQSNTTFFKQVNMTEFECRSIREVEQFKKMNQDDKNALFEEKHFLLRLVNLHMNNLQRTTKEYENMASLKKKLLIDLKSLKPQSISISEEDDPLNPQEDSKYLSLFKTYSLNTFTDTETSTIVEKMLKNLGLEPNYASAFKFLLQNSIFTNPNIHFVRSNTSTQNPSRIEELAQQIFVNQHQIADLDKEIRRDLTHLDVYTLDSYPETEEVDDGLSFEIKPDGTEYVYIHIADPTRYIGFGSELDEFAQKRVSTIYMPEMKIPMLPRVLAVDLMSINEDKLNHVFTFAARVLPDGEITDEAIFPAIVSKVKRIDYDVADSILSASDSKTETKEYQVLQRLLKIASARLIYRMRRGANVFNMPKPEVSVSDNGSVNVSISRDYNSSSRKIVQEMMVLANEISAKFAYKNNISIPYRATTGGIQEDVSSFIVDFQHLFGVDKSISDDDFINLIIAQHKYHNAVNLAPACFNQIPTFHSGLGVDAYAQVSSPIRRYMDMLIHYQLKAHLRGEKPPLEWSQIQQMLPHLDFKTKSIAALQKNSERFWLCKFFEQNRDRIYEAFVLDCKNESYGILSHFTNTIFLKQIGMKAKVETTESKELGEVINVKVAECDPYMDQLTFVEVPLLKQ